MLRKMFILMSVFMLTLFPAITFAADDKGEQEDQEISQEEEQDSDTSVDEDVDNQNSEESDDQDEESKSNDEESDDEESSDNNEEDAENADEIENEDSSANENEDDQDEENEDEAEEGTVNVTYVDQDGKEVADSEELTGEVGETYETEEKDIDGYELDEVHGDEEGEFKEDDIDVEFVYKEEESEEEKEVILPTITFNEPICWRGEEVYAGYTMKKPNGITFDREGELGAGETIVITATPDENVILTHNPRWAKKWTIKDNVGTIEYTFQELDCEVEEGTVNVTYVDQDGEEIADSEELTGDVGDSYKAEEKDVDGYELDEVNGDEEGEFVEGDIDVEFVYEKEDSDNGSKSDDESESDGETASAGDNSDGGADTDTDEKEGEKLPKTATNTPLFIAIGGTISLIGGALLFIGRKFKLGKAK